MVYKYKTKERSPKDFSNYQNPIYLFVSLEDCNVNPREVLKIKLTLDQIYAKLKKINPKSKSEDQIRVIQNVQNFFDLREKIINFSRDYYILLSEAKYKQNMEKDSKYSLLNKCLKDYQ